MPVVRPFRALRYRPASVASPPLVVSPPYDVISPARQRQLLDRDPRNIVRLDLPHDEPGDEPDARYRRAARTLAQWRSDGTLAKDPRPSIYAYEQTYRPPGSSDRRTQRGFFARVRLEPFGSDGGILPHERTLAGPREDRYRLLRATGVNTSPVVGLYADAEGTAHAALQELAAADPALDFVDDEEVRHRMWVAPDDGSPDGPIARSLAAASSGPITIADGHHRYVTALRYRDERRMSRSCEEDPAFDYVLMLLLDAAHEPLTVLPTHRLVRELGGDGLDRLCTGIGDWFDSRTATRDELVAAFTSGADMPGGRGRFGLWTRAGGHLLDARPRSFRDAVTGGEALRRLDVTLLETALERLAGIDAEAISAGRLAFTKSAAEALDLVDSGAEGVDAAFLLEPTPISDVIAVASEGDVMPQKSTYFYPKAASGLVINPHEW